MARTRKENKQVQERHTNEKRNIKIRKGKRDKNKEVKILTPSQQRNRRNFHSKCMSTQWPFG
jgi:hypothetical protein